MFKNLNLRSLEKLFSHVSFNSQTLLQPVNSDRRFNPDTKPDRGLEKSKYMPQIRKIFYLCVMWLIG